MASQAEPQAQPACRQCGSAEAGFRCSRCQQARYCDATCQRAHWKTHRSVCRPPPPANVVLVLAFEQMFKVGDDPYLPLQVASLRKAGLDPMVRTWREVRTSIAALASCFRVVVLSAVQDVFDAHAEADGGWLRAYVAGGGTLIVHSVENSPIQTVAAQFGLPWRYEAYHRTQHALRPGSPHASFLTAAGCPASISIKSVMIAGVAPEDVVYAPTADSTHESLSMQLIAQHAPSKVAPPSPENVSIATHTVGDRGGLLVWVGDVNLENGVQAVIAAFARRAVEASG